MTKALNLDLFVQGLIAGYGIAIPVGPIAILIIELGIRRGFSVAFCAGAGAASADLVYATIASVAGTFLVSILKPYSSIIHTVSALVLIALGLWLLYVGRRNKGETRVSDLQVSSRSGTVRFSFRVNFAQSPHGNLFHYVDFGSKIKHRWFP